MTGTLNQAFTFVLPPAGAVHHPVWHPPICAAGADQLGPLLRHDRDREQHAGQAAATRVGTAADAWGCRPAQEGGLGWGAAADAWGR